MQEPSNFIKLPPDDIEETCKKESRHYKMITFVAVFTVSAFFFIFTFLKTTVPVAYVSRAQEKTARDIVLGIAEINDFHTLTLKFERGGTVLDDDVMVGQPVKKGDQLMRLDTEELELYMEQLSIEKEFAEEEAKLPRKDDFELRRAKSRLMKVKEYVEQGRRPADDLNEEQRNLALLQADHERMLLKDELDIKVRKNDIEKIQYSLDRMTLYSPIDATVVEVLARKGDLVQQSQPVIKLIDERRLVVGLVSEDDYDKVKVGLPIELKLKAFPNTTFKGDVDQILPTSNSESHKFEIYIKTDVPMEKMIPGLTGEFVIVAGTREKAVVVPSQAVFEGHVMKVEGKRVKKVKVKTGFVNFLEIEILEGIESGDIVVTESNNLFKDGQLVRTAWE